MRPEGVDVAGTQTLHRRPYIAQCHFVVGGLLIGFSKSNSPKVRKMSESGRIIPLKKRIWG